MSDRTAHRSDTRSCPTISRRNSRPRRTRPICAGCAARASTSSSAHYVRNLRSVALKPWARRGGRGVFLNHDASRTTNDCYVCEIPPAGKLAPHRQMFEEMVFVLDGRGSTTVWNDAGARVTFEWKAGAIFGIPLNCWHQHFNGSGQAPARYVAVTNAPPVINLYEDVDFVFNSQARLQGPLQRRAGLLRRRQGAAGMDARHQFHRRCRQPAACDRRRARRRRRPHPLQSRARLRCPATSRSSRSPPTRRRMRTGRAPMSSSSVARATR